MPNFLVYHGSGTEFDEFKQSASRVKDDYYGGGIAYFTDTKNIALQYAKAMTKLAKIKNPLAAEKIYTCNLRINKLFDVNEKFTGKELTKFIKNPEDFARKAGLLTYGVDKYDVIFRLKSGDMELTGDELFRGLSGGMNSTEKTRDQLKRMGYDGLKYNGGETKGWGNGTKHNVYIPYYPDRIKILEVKPV